MKPKNVIWWAVFMPNDGMVGQLYVTKASAEWSWGNVEGVQFKKIKVVVLKERKKA